MRLISFLVVLSLVLYACGGGSSSGTSASAETPAETPAESAPSTPAAEESTAGQDDPAFKKGQTVYNTYCIACHMADGNGVPNLNPPVASTDSWKNDWVNGDKDRIIDQVLNGGSEPVTLNGETYTGVMTPHNFLSDEDIAAVLTYVRGSFGNTSGPVTVEEVAAARAKK